MERDYYEVLGVERTASAEEIKRAYRECVQYHPDRNPDDPEALEKFREASRAYEILHVAETRARYDQFGHAGWAGGSAGRIRRFRSLRCAARVHAGLRRFEDLFGRSRGRGSLARPAARRDVQTRLRVSLEEVATGVEKTIRVKLLQRCETCHGKAAAGSRRHVRHARKRRGASGSALDLRAVRQRACLPALRGEGKVVIDPPQGMRRRGPAAEDKRIKVRIPAGVQGGTTSRCAAKGTSDREAVLMETC